MVALIGASLTARAAHGQALLERFDPAERGSRFFVADSLELDGNLRLATGVVTSYGNRLRTYHQGGAAPEASDLVVRSVWVHPGASLVVAPGARFALDLPVALQSGNDVALAGTFFGRPASPSLGDVRGSFDLRLAGSARPDTDGALLAAGVSAYLPTGSSSDYTGDDFPRFDLRVANVVRHGHFVLASRVGYMYRRNDLPPFGDVSLGSEANAVLACGYRSERIVLGPEVYGSTTLKDAYKGRSTPIEALLGAHVSLGDLRVGAGIGTLLAGGLGAAKLRGVLSLEWVPSAVARDRDRDGVLDADDMCPDVPGLASANPGSRGCPAPPQDTDHDGIFDTDDACSDLAGIRTQDPMTHGCPDADHDGIPDPLDACPSVAGERSVLPRYNGCPADADGDGILDLQDACPDEPGVATDDQATNGCPRPPPPPPDRDEDGLTDGEDACPDEKGVSSPDETLNGCPMVRMIGDLLVLARPIELTTATGQRPVGFTQDSEQVLADIATFLVVAHPEVPRVRVSARGDAGERVKKPRAAQDEARAVVERLVVYGVPRKRLEVRGVVDPAKNLRFELHVRPARD